MNETQLVEACLNGSYRAQKELYDRYSPLMMGICICFLVISVVMRTKDDVRFVVPYVEFAKQTKGARPLVLDTSAIIDGRVTDLYRPR